jgi:hypothetical protein
MCLATIEEPVKCKVFNRLAAGSCLTQDITRGEALEDRVSQGLYALAFLLLCKIWLCAQLFQRAIAIIMRLSRNSDFSFLKGITAVPLFLQNHADTDLQEDPMPRERLLELPDLDRLADKRSDVRYGLNGLVPAVIQSLDGRDLDVVMLDVSRGGLGILAHGFTQRVGDSVNFCIDHQAPLVMVVRWMRRSRLGEQEGLGLTRVGLALLVPGENLVERLRVFDCVDQ